VKITRGVGGDGRVYCTKQRKTVDVLSCYECKRLIEVDLDSKKPRVTCELDDAEPRRTDVG